MSKYGNKKTEVYGITFASNAEANRYIILKDELRRGLIKDLKLQSVYVLAPSVVINGRKRPPLRYFADFDYYTTSSGRHVVEDVKGKITEGYRIKRHLMKSVFNIDILETK